MMAQLPFYGVVDRWYAELNSAIEIGHSTIVVKDSAGAELPSPPFLISVGYEMMLCTNVTLNSPSGGLDTLMVIRGFDSTQEKFHGTDQFVEQLNYSLNVRQLHDRVGSLERVLVTVLGDGEGVVQSGPSGKFEVVETSPASMRVLVKDGAAVIAGQPVSNVNSITSTLIVPPASPNDRIDLVQLSQTGGVVIKSGNPAGSPEAPSPDANHFPLAEIYVTHDATTIIGANITDVRTFR